MEEAKIKKVYEILDNIQVTEDNQELIMSIKEAIDKNDTKMVLKKIKELTENNNSKNSEQEEILEEKLYPEELSNITLEHNYIGMLLNNPKLISKYYFLYGEAFFEDDDMLNIYKSVLFTEGQASASEAAKRGYNFARENENVYKLKKQLEEAVDGKNYDMEEIYVDLKKLFILRDNYLKTPIKYMQDKIVEICNYKLYDKMSIEEVENTVQQVNITGKFKQSILSEDLTKFLKAGDNNLTNGLNLPFPILTKVFKGIRRGETMSVAMPSNSGKSRFTTNIAAYTALVHKKKVLIISNEMSEEKMKLCLITTIVNHPEIQKIHGKKIRKTEGELLEFKFRPDNTENTQVDEGGFVIKNKGETREEFIKRLYDISTEFKNTISATEWVNKQIDNSIYFINITDHTNDELRNVIMNYYYKEQIEYVFYDTLKTDTANIGKGEEIKKTATILSNLAQNFNMFICSTLQLEESTTLPINLSINDLAVSKTVKEVLDTLCLMKQINSETYENYEYSLNEVDTVFYNIEKSDNPDIRYYACVVDKNRAGAKPKLLFKLNLAYNSWEELGYLRIKQ